MSIAIILDIYAPSVRQQCIINLRQEIAVAVMTVWLVIRDILKGVLEEDVMDAEISKNS